MNPTKEQLSIIAHPDNAVVNAAAGSGKTSTLISYVEEQARKKRVLYLAFNRSIKSEARDKFESKGLKNVVVETAHSLAYKKVFKGSTYELNPTGYKPYDWIDIFKLPSTVNFAELSIFGYHINEFLMYFCNSSKAKVGDLDYRDSLRDPKGLPFVEANYEVIERYTRKALKLMNDGDIPITHDFYLKKFQLSQPKLGYEVILLDEAQDTSEVVMDFFQLQSHATLIAVGDHHQQIYGWRHAVNSLSKFRFPEFKLTASFRFPQAVANVAMHILSWKEGLQVHNPRLQIRGLGGSSSNKTKAIIARSNTALLARAIDEVSKKGSALSLYFEGNLSSYTYAQAGGSIYDVLNLYYDRRKYIKDPLLKKMKDIDALLEYIDKSGDAEMRMLYDMVDRYGDRLPSLLKNLRNNQVSDDKREEAHLIFTTCHRAKGMEYHTVEILRDFITLERLGEKSDEVSHSILAEEINLLYVAVTRAEVILEIPDIYIGSCDRNTLSSDHIKILREDDPTHYSKKYSGPKNSGKFWSEREEKMLEKAIARGDSVVVIAEDLGRSIKSVQMKAEQLALVIN